MKLRISSLVLDFGEIAFQEERLVGAKGLGWGKGLVYIKTLKEDNWATNLIGTGIILQFPQLKTKSLQTLQAIRTSLVAPSVPHPALRASSQFQQHHTITIPEGGHNIQSASRRNWGSECG